MKTTVADVPLANIASGAGNHRQGVQDVTALARSLAAVGLLQPIGLVPLAPPRGTGPDYQVLYGRRRLEAARSLAWPAIRAVIYPPWVGMEAGTVRRLEAVENLERADLNPVEEVLAVSRLLESVAGRKAEVWTDAAPEHLQRAADLLGRSLPWVRDRAYLTRLCPAVRAMVADRRLPLAQAREIAKLASAQEQTTVAGWAVGHDAGFGAKYSQMVQSVATVRRDVAGRLSTLRGVPWEPGVAFAGRPACTGCPDNSAHATLFGIDKDDAAPEARCLNLVCYNAKMRAAEAAVQRAVKDLKPVKDVAPTPAGVRAIRTVPAYVKPATVARQLARARGVEPKAAAGAKSGPEDGPREPSPEQKLRGVHVAWMERVEDLVALRLCADPARLACFLLARVGETMAKHVQSWRREPDEKVRKIMDPVLKHVAAAAPADYAFLAADVKAEDLFSSQPDPPPLWIVRRLAGLMDVNLPREPVLEDFLPKKAATPEKPSTAENAEHAERKMAGKKTKAKKGGKKAKTSGKEALPPPDWECDNECETCSAEDCESRDDEGPGH